MSFSLALFLGKGRYAASINFISWGILYVDLNQYLIVLPIQTVIFILTGWLLFRFLFRRYIVTGNE